MEPYNATLSVHQLVENADECVVSQHSSQQRGHQWGRRPCILLVPYSLPDLAVLRLLCIHPAALLMS